jgi:hypothetical protein
MREEDQIFWAVIVTIVAAPFIAGLVYDLLARLAKGRVK